MSRMSVSVSDWDFSESSMPRTASRRASPSSSKWPRATFAAVVQAAPCCSIPVAGFTSSRRVTSAACGCLTSCSRVSGCITTCAAGSVTNRPIVFTTWRWATGWRTRVRSDSKRRM